MAAGRAGAGYDVLEFKRGDAGLLAPLPGLGLRRPDDAACRRGQLPKRADVILNTPGLNPAAATPASYVFCLQVR